MVDDLALDLDHYRAGRTFQPITGFRAGIIDRPGVVEVAYGHPVSYGIRRCEFDDYLLRRSSVRLHLGTPVVSLERRDHLWILNDDVAAPVLVGAGGHWCPVARLLNSGDPHAALVVAREAEFAVAADASDAPTTAPERPELYFSADFKGYGWCFRKQGHMNIGLGSLDRHECLAAADAFVDFLKARHAIPGGLTWKWRGHAYLLSQPRCRRVRGEGVLLAGDAAGLAYPQSGEGIRPAIESGLLAAQTIVDARGDYSLDRLTSYDARLKARFGPATRAPSLSDLIPDRLVARLGTRLMGFPWFVRHVVLDGWFLRAADQALVA